MMTEDSPNWGGVVKPEQTAPADANAHIRIERLEGALRKAVDIIEWMSGASDFGPGGFAHIRWLKAQADMADVYTALRGH